jgi:hypothetical protein
VTKAIKAIKAPPESLARKAKREIRETLDYREQLPQKETKAIRETLARLDYRASREIKVKRAIRETKVSQDYRVLALQHHPLRF